MNYNMYNKRTDLNNHFQASKYGKAVENPNFET